MPEKAADKAWVGGILTLVDFLGNNRNWDESISQIHVDARGRLVLVPGKGREKFIIGIDIYEPYVYMNEDGGLLQICQEQEGRRILFHCGRIIRRTDCLQKIEKREMI